jgi:mRNA-degrading endonuclease RelE of RelBE toxin-antitoxin system
MSYRDEYHPKTKADLKKLDKPVLRELFDTHINTILDDPYEVGEALHGSLEGISTYHFRLNRVEYRIAFAVKEESKTVYILMVAKRENFYEILRRRLS